jgi:hypothetical protein
VYGIVTFQKKNAMRTILLSLLALSLFSSCRTYQYVTLDAEKTTKNDVKELVWENDTVKVIFNFNGRWGGLNLTVLNKSAQPISINWQKSAVVYTDASYNLFDMSARITGDIERNLLDTRIPDPYIQRMASINATILTPNSYNFLPPKTYVNQKNLQLFKVRPSVKALPDDLPVEKIKADESTVNYRKAVYDLSSTPFKFKLFLTYDAANGQQFFTEHLFYVTEIRQVNNAGTYHTFINSDGDKFYWAVQVE